MVVDADHVVFGVEVADCESERFTDSQSGREQQFQEQAMWGVLGCCEQGVHFLHAEGAFLALVVVLGSFAALELAERVDRDLDFAG